MSIIALRQGCSLSADVLTLFKTQPIWFFFLHNSLAKRKANKFPGLSKRRKNSWVVKKRLNTSSHCATRQVGRRHQLIFGHTGAVEQAAKDTATHRQRIKLTSSEHAGKLSLWGRPAECKTNGFSPLRSVALIAVLGKYVTLWRRNNKKLNKLVQHCIQKDMGSLSERSRLKMVTLLLLES